MAGYLKNLDVLEEWLIRCILINRNIALSICFLVELLLPLAIVSKFKGLTSIRARAHAAKLALLVEKNEIHKAKEIFLSSFSFYQKLPKAFFLVFELMLDKNVLIKSLIETSLKLKPYLNEEFKSYQVYLTKLIKALLLSKNKSDQKSASKLLIEALNKFDKNNLKNVIVLAFELRDDSLKESVLRKFYEKLKHTDRELFDWFLYYKYQSSEELDKLEETVKAPT